MIEQKFHVRFDELDAKGNIPAHAFLKYFQESAALDSNQLGFGFKDLSKNNQAWILTHMQVRALQQNIPLQDVTVKTKHVFSDRLLNRRQFTIYGADGTALFEGSSWWAIIDVQKRRLVRTPQHLIDMNPVQPESLEAEENFKASLPTETPSHTLEMITREEDLDLNAHVNNTHYAAWAVESVPADVRDGKKLDRMLISFKNECRAGEKIMVAVYPEATNAFWHVLTRTSDGKEAARIYTRWA